MRAAFAGQHMGGGMREDFIAAAGMLRGIADGNGRLGVVGFCYGGAIATSQAMEKSFFEKVKSVLAGEG